MQWFSNLKIGAKLILGFLVVAVIGAVIGVLGLVNMSRINDMATTMYEKEVLGLRYASEAQAQLLFAGRTLRGAMLAPDQQLRDTMINNALQRLQNAKDSLHKAEATLYSAEGKALFQQATQAVQAYEKDLKEVLDIVRAEPFPPMRDSVAYVVGPMRENAARVDGLLDKLADLKESNASEFNDLTTQVYERSRWLLALAVLVGMLAGVLIGVLLTRHLTRQLGGEPADVAHLAVQIAAGDLTSRVDVSQAQPGSVVYAMRATCRPRWCSWWAACARPATTLPPAHTRLPPATPTCRSAPRSRPATCSRPRPRWRSSPAPCNRTPRPHSRPPSWC